MIMSKKTKNVHLIRTDGPSRLGRFVDTGNLFLRVPNDLPRGENVNMYITVDEEIKLNDYITDGYKVWKWKDDSSLLGRKKVVLSDDPTLLDSGVQAIPNDFLEWFVKNSDCEEVEVKHFGNCCGNQLIAECINCKNYNPVYKIILPKEEPKQEFTTVNGSSGCTITVTDEIGKPIPYCGGLEEPKPHSFCETPEEKCTMNYCNENGCQNRERQLTDLEIAIRLEEIEREEPKQETNFFESLQKYFKETPREKVLEDWNKSAHLDNVGPTVEEFVENSNEERFNEAAELYLENVNTKVHKDLERDGWMKIGFISGAKSDAARDYWFEKFQEQDKNKFSEEEVIQILINYQHYLTTNDDRTADEWFEQLRKK
jgi:hypothetical protein